MIESHVIQGDCLEVMQGMADNSIDFLVTDPPYGLKFVGKRWDYDIPSVEVWKEALRVCKPGCMAAVFGGSRTFHRLAVALEDAGWEIRDTIMWLYGSGFPKSHNFGKKLGGEWGGYGTALKPAFEPVTICMKPLHGTFAQNAEKWGVAGINVDACRVGNMPRTTHKDGNYKGKGNDLYQSGLKNGYYSKGSKSRWPANIILDEEAAKALDEMSGVSKSSGGDGYKNSMFCGGKKTGGHGKGDIGGASRFYYCAKASTKERNEGLGGMPLKEGGIKNDSGRGFSQMDPYAKIMVANNHPTVKPIALMKYILKLLAPPNTPTCLDPFCGSGTTLLAAYELGISCIGIEREAKYCEIANKRLESIKKKSVQFSLC